MPDEKQKLRDLFADKTSGEGQPAEEDIAPDEVAVSTEDAIVEPIAPIEPEAPVENAEVDVVKEAKDIYMRWEKSDDPVVGLDQLIGELQELRESQGAGLENILPGEDAPLNQPANL